jgi:hypothetical protein
MEMTDLRPNVLVQTPGNQLLKISTIYDTMVTAELVYPVPPRTTVRSYLPAAVKKWREPTDAMVARYDTAWSTAQRFREAQASIAMSKSILAADAQRARREGGQA